MYICMYVYICLLCLMLSLPFSRCYVSCLLTYVEYVIKVYIYLIDVDRFSVFFSLKYFNMMRRTLTVHVF